MNFNNICTDGFSNPESRKLLENDWPNDPKAKTLYQEGLQCGGCSFYANLNSDWGLCLNTNSSHFKETIFEHFTCTDHVEEGWDRPHSFTQDKTWHCVCNELKSILNTLKDKFSDKKLRLRIKRYLETNDLHYLNL